VSYRLPQKLVGTKTTVGEVPARIRPVFRDRDDLSSASNLGGTVKKALSDSENMIVVCSPEAVASHWVNEEIRQFAHLGKQDRIFCVIVDGEPPGVGTTSTCFPAALAEIGLDEPLAADVRKWADGKHLSKLKIVSGMLGLPLDQLRRRDLQKRQKVWALALLASIALAAVLIAAVTARISAQQRRDSGESLVVFKLNELRTMLNIADDPSNLSRLNEWNKQELARLIAEAGEGENALTTSALAIREQGIGVWRTGELGNAMEKFQESWALLAAAYQRDNGNYLAFFELGQAEYWIGLIYKELGALEAAEVSLSHYAEITRQLIVMQPENAEWVLEMAFALTNLGSLQRESDVNKPDRALQLLQSALEYNQIALVLDPQNSYYQSELGQSHAFLADAQRGVCDLEGAFQSRQKQVALEQGILAGDSENTDRMKRLGWAFSGYAVVQGDTGDVEGSIESYEMALELMAPVLLKNPEIRYTSRFILDRRLRLAMLKAGRGGTEHTWEILTELDKDWQRFLQSDEERDESIKVYVTFLFYRAELAHSRGETELVIQILENAMAKIIGILDKLPGDRDAGNLLMQAVFQSWSIRQQSPPGHIMALLPDYTGNSGRTQACQDASLGAKKAVMLGDMTRAGELTNYLLDSGYTELNFMRFCRKHSLCKGR
jgi:tetratricopeptide (TPR) repeat protein